MFVEGCLVCWKSRRQTVATAPTRGSSWRSSTRKRCRVVVVGAEPQGGDIHIVLGQHSRAKQYWAEVSNAITHDVTKHIHME